VTGVVIDPISIGFPSTSSGAIRRRGRAIPVDGLERTCEQLALFAVERCERFGADLRAHRGHQLHVEPEVVLREQLGSCPSTTGGSD
jgi:hypothetical protein